jgi:hypothetical protein
MLVTIAGFPRKETVQPVDSDNSFLNSTLFAGTPGATPTDQIPYDGWQFMIVLPAKCLPSVWSVLSKRSSRACPTTANTSTGTGVSNSSGGSTTSLIAMRGTAKASWCMESAVKKPGKRSILRVASLSISRPSTCGYPASAWTPTTSTSAVTLASRQRWGIETSFLVEKCQGYHYEHAFSYTWNAMKGYHYLMRLAHSVNALALATKRVASQVRTLGVQAFLRWVRESCAHRWLRREWIDRFLMRQGCHRESYVDISE